MNLTLFFRLILMSIFQKSMSLKGDLKYDGTYFYCPRVVAKDGWSVSLQIHSGNYCSSENGYRKLGHTMKEVEFGYPSELEELLFPFADDPDSKETVGRVPIEVLEAIFIKRGGIDWEATISIDEFNKRIKS